MTDTPDTPTTDTEPEGPTVQDIVDRATKYIESDNPDLVASASDTGLLLVAFEEAQNQVVEATNTVARLLHVLSDVVDYATAVADAALIATIDDALHNNGLLDTNASVAELAPKRNRAQRRAAARKKGR